MSRDRAVMLELRLAAAAVTLLHRVFVRFVGFGRL